MWQTQFIHLEFNAEASSVEFRKFILLVTISRQNCQKSNSSSNSVDSSYFCRIAYRDLFSQMHALCQRHTFNHCNEPPWLNSRVKFTCDSRTPRGDTTPGIPGSRPDFDRSHGRNTHLRSHERRSLFMNAKSDYLMVDWRHHSAIPS